jgi:hypothetical protein
LKRIGRLGITSKVVVGKRRVKQTSRRHVYFLELAVFLATGVLGLAAGVDLAREREDGGGQNPVLHRR